MTELEKRMERWKSELLDTGKRNKMINYRDSKLTTLTITEPVAEDLFERIAIHEKTLKFMKRIDRESDIRVSAMLSLLETLSYPLVVEEGDIRSNTTELERNKTLKNLRSKAKLAQEEQGTHILYLSFGFIYWREKPGASWMRSPLLLVPVTVGQSSLKAPFTLSRYDDDVVVNPTLEYRFNSEFNISLPSFELGKDAFTAYMDQVEELVDKKGWRLAKNEVSLGLLSFLKISMYHDLEDNRERMLHHPVLQAIAGEQPATVDASRPLKPIDFDALHPRDCHEVVDADSSQEEAILLSRAGVSFVMQGPPGTGKSQTITNIIAEALADGKKVLFVSEKAAALQVVLKRLTEANLADFCLPLHNYKANKKDIIHNIGDNLYLPKDNERAVSILPLIRLMEDRKFLNAYAAQLHTVLEPFGQSVYMAYGKLSQFENATYVSFVIPEIKNVSSEQHGTYYHLVADFENALKHLGTNITACPWYGTTTKVGNQAYKNYLMDKTMGLDTELLQIVDLKGHLLTAHHLSMGETWAEVQSAMGEITEMLQLGMFPESWLTSKQRNALIIQATESMRQQRRIQRKKDELQGQYMDAIFDAEVASWQKSFADIKQTFQKTGFADARNEAGLFEYALHHIRQWTDDVSQLEQLDKQYHDILEQVGRYDAATLCNVQRMQSFLQRVANKPDYVLPSWLNVQGYQQAETQLQAIDSRVSEQMEMRKKLSVEWDECAEQYDEADLRRLILSKFPVESGDDLQAYAVGMLEKAQRLLEALEQLEQHGTAAQAILGMDGPLTLDTAERIARILQALASMTHIEPEWLDVRQQQKLLSKLDEGNAHMQCHAACMAAILRQWNERVFALDIPAIFARFRMKYTAPFMDAMKQHQQDVRLLQRYAAHIGQEVSSETVFALQKQLNELEAEKRRFQELVAGAETQLPIALGAAWQALHADADSRKEKADKLLEEASAHAQAYTAMTAALMKAWTPDCFEIDAEPMLARFTTNYKARFAHLLNRQYKQDAATLRAYRRVPTSAPDDETVISFLKQVIQWKAERQWFADHEKAFASLLGARYTGPETDWNAVRIQIDDAYHKVKRLLQHAEELDIQIQRITAQITTDWDPEILELDIAPVLERFKTVYDLSFHATLTAYRQDLDCLGMASRAMGDSISFEAMDALARQLEQLRAEENWFSDHEAQLRGSFGAMYRGWNTEWNVLKNDVAGAIVITDCFPYGNISTRAITSICNAVEQMQLSAQVRMLLDRVNSDRIHEIRQFLDQLGGKPFDAAAASVQDDVLPWLRAKLARANEQQRLLGSLAAAHRAEFPLNYAAVEQLANTLHIIHAHTRWLEENHSKNSALFGQIYSGIATDRESLRSGLLYAKEILALFDHQNLSDETIELACSGINGEQQMQFGALLHLDLAQMKQELASALGPVSDTSALSGIALRMKALLEAAITLQRVTEQIAVYRQDGDTDADRMAQALPLIVEIAQMRDEAARKDAQHASAFGERYKGEATDWRQVIADLLHLDAFLSKDRKTVQAEQLRRLCAPAQDESSDTGAKRCELAGICRQMQRLMEQAGPKLQSFADEFEEQALHAASATLTAIAGRYRACMDHFDALSHWLEYIETRNACQEAGLASFTDAIVSRDNAIPDVLRAFERAFYTQWISSHMDDIPAVQTFKKNMFESKIAEFAKLDVSQYEIAQRRIRQSILSTFPPLDETAPKGSELAILRHEMEKRARYMPLRKLFQQIPSLLLTLKPCLMMSPLSVAYFLPADQYHFDLVIFDEASQIFPQDAVGAMFRADQVIIAGDTRQMPPTNFFGANAGGSTDYDDESEEMEELGESILEECEVKLPARTLQWHYRSQHEHLIAFSNREIYGNHLVTFPSSNERMKDAGVEFVYVKHGYYESAPRNCNKVEAERIVELIKEHIETHPERSLGVIAFSEKQQQAIAAAVQRFREQQNTPRYEQFFAEDKEDEFFIKNLENVQGDERDTILFSIGYARTKKQIAEGRPMSMRFGPLGLAGGERRLNVAITRAKINVKLVSSIQPSDIDLTRTKSEGVRMLRSYIEFAMHGTSALAQSGHNHDHDEFANTIAEFIRAHGYQVVQHVGLSGYQIDLAVKHPSELADLYAVGIECDGNAYASARTARDRERLRKTVLTHMGWNLYRVWSTAWFSDPQHEGERLLAYIQKAIAGAEDKVREIEAEKRRMEAMKAQAAQDEQLRLAREREERLAHEQQEQEAKAAETRRLERQRQRVIEAGQRTSVPPARQQAFRQMSFADMRNSPISAGHVSTSAQQGYAVPADDLAWAVVGAAVALRDGSVGRIASIDGPYLAVSVDGRIKKFKYPNAFTDGFLTRADLDNSNGNEKTTVSENANAQKAQPRQEGRGLEELCYELGQNGFRYIHDKSLSELTWVYYNRAQETLFENIVRSYAVKWRLEKRGCRATGFKPAWCISQ